MSYTIQQALIPVEDGYTTVDVQIENDRITAIATQLPVNGTAIDGHNKLLLPGFFNAHTHPAWMYSSVAFSSSSRAILVRCRIAWECSCTALPYSSIS